MAKKKVRGTIRPYSGQDARPVSAWISAEKRREIGAQLEDVIFISIGWSGSMSARAVIRGELPAGYATDDIVLGADCMREGNFKDGAVCSYWLHNIWY